MATDQKIVKPKLDDSAWSELARYPWPGNIRELRNVLERAVVLFVGEMITGAHVRENLLRLKVPDRREEQDALWAASEDLMGIDGSISTGYEQPLPHPSHYADWFSYFDTIDLRRHLRDVEVVLIEAALEKSEGMVSHAAKALKLQRTTLIEKMKKLMIERPMPSKNGSRDRINLLALKVRLIPITRQATQLGTGCLLQLAHFSGHLRYRPCVVSGAKLQRFKNAGHHQAHLLQ